MAGLWRAGPVRGLRGAGWCTGIPTAGQMRTSLLDDSGRELELGRHHADLSLTELFVAYFALGGTADLAGMAAHLRGTAEVLDAHQRDVAAHALNERLADLGCTEHLLLYAVG